MIKRGKSMCVFSAKGGVGKTINIINLAGIFELLGKRVLIIDFDLYGGDIGAYLNKKIKKDIYDLSIDMDINEFMNITKYVTKYDDYIHYIASPKDIRVASKININNIKKIIYSATLEYDIVLIDTNHALNDISLSILQSVDNTLFILNNEPLDVKSMRSLLSILKESGFNNYKVLLNNSRDPFKDYFDLYDIKKLIKHNIDYSLSVELYLQDIEKYIMDSIVITLDKKFPSYYMRDYKTYLTIATDMLGGDIDE